MVNSTIYTDEISTNQLEYAAYTVNPTVNPADSTTVHRKPRKIIGPTCKPLLLIKFHMNSTWNSFDLTVTAYFLLASPKNFDQKKF